MPIWPNFGWKWPMKQPKIKISKRKKNHYDDSKCLDEFSFMSADIFYAISMCILISGFKTKPKKQNDSIAIDKIVLMASIFLLTQLKRANGLIWKWRQNDITHAKNLWHRIKTELKWIVKKHDRSWATRLVTT